MKVRELIELLSKCNPEARVTVSINHKIGDYTWDTDHMEINDFLSWPEGKETASNIELCYDT